MTNPQHPHDPSQQPYQQPMYQQPPQPGTYQPGPNQQGPYPAGYPMSPAQPPKKKSKLPLIIVGIVVAILVICGISAVAGVSSDSDDASTSGTSTTTTSEPEKAAAAIGTPVRDGKFEFVVTGVQQGLASVGDNPYLTEKAQGQFVVVSLTVKNTSKEPHSFSPTDQKLLDAAGATFDPDTAAQIALGETDIAVWDNINPGNTVTVKLVFDMPKGTTPTAVELHDSMFSDGVKVSLAK